MKITKENGAQFESEPQETKWLMLLVGVLFIGSFIAIVIILILIAKNPDTLNVTGLTELFGTIATIYPRSNK